MKKILAHCTAALLLNTVAAVASADDFKLQSFINNDKMLDLVYHFEGTPDDENQDEARLFVAEKTSHTPFTNYNLNEADSFAIFGSNHWISFDRNYQITKEANGGMLNNKIGAYDFGVYPIDMALATAVEQCGLKEEQLTSFAFNHPATLYSAIVYIFTTQDKSGHCSQTLFDTFDKVVTCQAMSSSCYQLTS